MRRGLMDGVSADPGPGDLLAEPLSPRQCQVSLTRPDHDRDDQQPGEHDPRGSNEGNGPSVGDRLGCWPRASGHAGSASRTRRSQCGKAERSADLLAGVEQRGRDTAVTSGRGPDRGGRECHECESESDTREDKRGKHPREGRGRRHPGGCGCAAAGWGQASAVVRPAAARMLPGGASPPQALAALARRPSRGARPTRAERRNRSEAAILDAARALFAEHGFDRTTIRAVAERAGVDPALVMQNFGNKDRLFAAAARWSVPVDQLTGATREELPHAALQHVLDAFENADQRLEAEALLRSAFTHPTARDLLRDQVMGQAQGPVAATIGGGDGELRAALLNACTLGLTISRYLIGTPAIVDANPADLHRILGPALSAIVDPA